MKKVLLIGLLSLMAMLISCKKEPKTYYGPGGLSGFGQSEMEISVTSDTRQVEVPVVYTEYHSSNYQSIAFTIDPASTAQRAVQFEVPTATIEDDYNLVFMASVGCNKDGLGGTFPITFYPAKITEPVVLILNAVNSPDEPAVAGCNQQLIIHLYPAQ